jgi:hypothetical protein
MPACVELSCARKLVLVLNSQADRAWAIGCRALDEVLTINVNLRSFVG